jgi:Zn-dependent protease
MRWNIKVLIPLFLLLVLLANEASAASLLSIFPGGKKPNGLIFSVALVGGLFAAIAAHELGHLLTGLAQGFRFELFTVFLLGVRRTETGVQVYLNKNVGYMGGVAATVPTQPGPENRVKFARTILAGPLSSLLYAAISALLLINTRSGGLWTFWLTSFATSAGLFLATTIPGKSGIFFTDRARFQRLMSKGQEGRSEQALLQLIAQSTATGNSLDIALEDARTLQQDKEAFMRFWGCYYEYQYHKEHGNADAAMDAKAKLIDIKDAMPASVWKALQIDV